MRVWLIVLRQKHRLIALLRVDIMIPARHTFGITDNFAVGFDHHTVEPFIVIGSQANGKLLQFVCEDFKIESVNVRVLFSVRFACLIEFTEELPHVFSPLESHLVREYRKSQDEFAVRRSP